MCLPSAMVSIFASCFCSGWSFIACTVRVFDSTRDAQPLSGLRAWVMTDSASIFICISGVFMSEVVFCLNFSVLWAAIFFGQRLLDLLERLADRDGVPGGKKHQTRDQSSSIHNVPLVSKGSSSASGGGFHAPPISLGQL